MPEESLHIELEDAASASWWARILYTLASQYGRTPLHFTGRSGDGHLLYRGATFQGPALEGPPQMEQWAPGVEEALRDLQAEIARDGWVESGRGVRPWEFSFVRPTRQPPPKASGL